MKVRGQTIYSHEERIKRLSAININTGCLQRQNLESCIYPTHPTSTIKENQMENQADMLIKISNLITAIELLPEDADRDNLLIKAGNLKSAIECVGCE